MVFDGNGKYCGGYIFSFDDFLSSFKNHIMTIDVSEICKLLSAEKFHDLSFV